MSAAFTLERVATLDEARPGWDELAEASRNPFATFEWAETWWRHFGRDRPLALHRVRTADGRLAAILPLYRADRGPLRLLRFVGHGPADQLGPICAPGDRPLAAEALRAIAAAHPRGLLLAERLAGDEGLAPLVGGRHLRHESSPVLDTEGLGWDEWLKTKSSNFRGQVRGRERKLAREHEIEFRCTESGDAVERDFDRFLALHDLRWATGESAAFAGARGAFHREFARKAFDRGWLRLWFLVAGGREVASLYCLRYAGSDWYYQGGRDPAWNRERVGFVLLTRTIRSAFDDGLDHFRFGLGDEEYKERFAARDPGLDTAVLGKDALTRLTSTALDSIRTLPLPVRRVLGRRVA
jgi:CelD/BcsL family acetyltransferase involved in cellulose biosynthesis